MIDENDIEDCCENCEEGIEPCCDEELKEHIEEQLVEQSEPEQQPQFIVEEKAYATSKATDLAKHLCCQNKFYIIYRAMEQMNEKELTKLRTDLRKFTKSGELHPQLESKFRHALAKFN